MVLAACLFSGIAAGAAAGGWGLLAGLVLAGVFGAAAARTGQPDSAVLRAAVLLSLGVLAARTFAAYLVPQHTGAAAAVVVVLATAAVAVGADVPAGARRVITGVLVLAAAGFTAICFGVEPVRQPEPAVYRSYPFGVLAAAWLFAAPFTVLAPGRPRVLVRVAGGVVVAVAVAVAALHQLGPVRLGLSDAPLADALAAADAPQLRTMLAAVVVVGTLPALLALLAAAAPALGLGPRIPRTLLVGGVAAVCAAVIPAAAALLIASTIAVTATVLGWLRRWLRSRGHRSTSA